MSLLHTSNPKTRRLYLDAMGSEARQGSSQLKARGSVGACLIIYSPLSTLHVLAIPLFVARPLLNQAIFRAIYRANFSSYVVQTS